jgi:hypothetical protein
MKRLLGMLPMIFALASASAFANTVNYTNLNVSMGISANDGGGDNMGALISGPGVSLFVEGGMPFDWFNGIEGSAPGSSGGGGTTIFSDDAFGTIGAHSFGEGDIELGEFLFDAGSFTFPTNGKDFTVKVPASLELITGTVITQCTNNACPTFTLTTKPGTLTLSFYVGADGLYYGSSGSFVTTPEPGSLGLMAIGLVAVACLGYRRGWASTPTM